MAKNQNRKRHQEWLLFSKMQIAMEKRWYKPFQKAIEEQMANVPDYLAQNGPAMALAHLNVLIPSEPLVPVFNRMYRKESLSYIRFKYNKIQKEIKEEASVQKALGFGISELWNDFINNFIREYVGNKIRRITQTTREFTRKEIERGVAEGLSINEMVANMRDIHAYSERRSRVISRTETVGIMNHANFVVASTTGLLMTDVWWTAQDHRVRYTHKHMHGESVRHGERFSNGLRYPGDPEGKAEEVIQCRCTTLQEPARDAQGRLIRTAAVTRLAAPEPK